MKKYIRTTVALLAFIFSTTQIIAQVVDIPDPIFLEFLIDQGIDTNGDGQIQNWEAEAVLELEIRNTDIEKLTGIKSFTNLRILKCYKNYSIGAHSIRGMNSLEIVEIIGSGSSKIKNWTFDDMSNLKSLTFNGNYANEINIIDLDSLTSLHVEGNGRLRTFNYSGLPNLKTLNYIRNHNTINLDLSGLIGLEELAVDYCDILRTLILGDFVKLFELTISHVNALTSFERGALPSLRNFDILYALSLTELDLEELPRLYDLSIGYTGITSLDIRGLEELTDIGVYQNKQLTDLKLSEIDNLFRLYIANNSILDTLNIYEVTSINKLFVHTNSLLPTLDLRALKNLTHLTIDFNLALDTILLASMPNLTELTIEGNNSIRALKIIDYPKLTKLILDRNTGLKNLTIRNLPRLENLTLSNTQIETLVLDDVPNLLELYLFWNVGMVELELNNMNNLVGFKVRDFRDLKRIGLNNLTGLVGLELTRIDSLKTIELSNLERLEGLSIIDCPTLAKLDLLGLNSLINLYLSMPSVKEVNLTNLPLLEKIRLSNADSLEVLKIKDLERLNDINLFRFAKLDSLELQNLPSLANLVLNGVLNLKTYVPSYDLPSLTDILIQRVDSLKTLDLSKLTNLQNLRINYNQGLNSMDINDYSSLKELSVYENPNLEHLKLRHLPELSLLYIERNNALLKLEMSDLLRLDELSLVSNLGLENLEVRGLPSLRKVEIRSLEALTNLSLDSLTSLIDLKFKYNNSIRILDLNNLTSLTTLSIDYMSSLIKINLDSLKSLSSLEIKNVSSMENLDLSNLTGLRGLLIENMEVLEDVVLENFDSLTYLKVAECKELTTLDLSDLTDLKKLFLFENRGLKNVNLAEVENLNRLEIRDSDSLGSLDLSDQQYLDILWIDDCNELSNLILPQQNELERLEVENCIKLATLNLATAQHLQQLRVVNVGALQSMDLRNKPELYNLYISQLSALKTLETDGFPRLGSVIVTYTDSLEVLDLRNAPWLSEVRLFSNASLHDLLLRSKSFYRINSLAIGDSDYKAIKLVCANPQDIPAIVNALDLSGNVDYITTVSCGGDFGNNVIEGTVYYDDLRDGCDVTDIRLPYTSIVIESENETNRLFATDEGYYATGLSEGKHELNIDWLPRNFFRITPDVYKVDFTTDSSHVVQDFCVQTIIEFPNLEVYISPITTARPGFEAKYLITYRNLGSARKSGTVDLIFNGNLMDFIEADVTPETVASNKLTWNFDELFPFESRSIKVTMELNRPSDIPPVNGDDILNFKTQIKPDLFDVLPDNNVDELVQIVVNSFDPNDKTCLAGNVINPDFIDAYVKYLIRFENTGSAEAIHVLVEDEIDTTTFDINTLEIINSSHPMEVYITEGNRVSFQFDSILLPFDDANNDGFVLFKIKTKPTLEIGDTLQNIAAIYFDYNLPIITNNAITKVDDYIGITPVANDEMDINLTPNPAHAVVDITSEYAIQRIEVVNSQGQKLRSIDLVGGQNNYQLDVREFTAGVYVVRLHTTAGLASRKLLTQ